MTRELGRFYIDDRLERSNPMLYQAKVDLGVAQQHLWNARIAGTDCNWHERAVLARLDILWLVQEHSAGRLISREVAEAASKLACAGVRFAIEAIIANRKKPRRTRK